METALHSAVGGMRAAAKRLEVSAGNVANMRSDGFAPGRVVQSSLEPAGTRAEAVPGSPLPPAGSTSAGLTAGAPEDRPQSRVAPEREAAEQLLARRAFEANLRTVEAVDRTHESLLDILA